MASFPHVRYEIRRHLGLAGYDFASFGNILDFGCGPGRFLLAFQNELAPHQRLFGCDVCADCAGWARKNLTFAEVRHNGIDPPLPWEDGQFDLVYNLSVFTHLRLDLQFRWAWEIHRVLRPGGVFFGSFHGPYFFDVFQERLRRGAARALEIASVGDDGLFCYLDYTLRPEDQGQNAVAAAHSPGFAREVFASFEQVKRFPQTVLAGGQDVYIWKKPESARPIAMPAAHAGKGWKSRLTGQAVDTDTQVIPFRLDGQKTFPRLSCGAARGLVRDRVRDRGPDEGGRADDHPCSVQQQPRLRQEPPRGAGHSGPGLDRGRHRAAARGRDRMGHALRRTLGGDRLGLSALRLVDQPPFRH